MANQQSEQPTIEEVRQRVDEIGILQAALTAFDESVRDGAGESPFRVEPEADPAAVMAIGQVIIERRQRVAGLVNRFMQERTVLASLIDSLIPSDDPFKPIERAYADGFVTHSLYWKLRLAQIKQHPSLNRMLNLPDEAPVNSLKTEKVALVPVDDGSEAQPHNNFARLIASYEEGSLTLTNGQRLFGLSATLAHALLTQGDQRMSPEDQVRLLYGSDNDDASAKVNAIATRVRVAKALEQQGLMVCKEPLPPDVKSSAGRRQRGYYLAEIPKEALKATGLGEK